MGKVKAMLKEYRVVLSYTVYDEGYVEATSEDEARDMVLSGRDMPDWKEMDVANWEIRAVEEVE